MRVRPAAALTSEALAAIAEQVRVLRWFARSGLVPPEDVHEMLASDNSGFSLDAAVRVTKHDHADPERLLCYWARARDVRFVGCCLRTQPKGRCLLMADT